MALTVLGESDWKARSAEHQARVEPLIAKRLTRRAAGGRHPVEDFLFEYYAYRPGQLRTWHPGAGFALAGRADDYLTRKGYVRVTEGVTASIAALAPAADRLRSTIGLLEQTRDRAPAFACFGRHEWAMVFGLDQETVRHSEWPLRVSMSTIEQVVRESPLQCTHFDAFRFYTDAARPLNIIQPTRATQPDHEQPGCLHAGMDLYKWAFMFSPWIPSEVVLECFLLARDVREVDMRVAPYDLTALGVESIEIETATGRAEFAALQRGFSDRQQTIRLRLIATLGSLERQLLACADAP